MQADSPTPPQRGPKKLCFLERGQTAEFGKDIRLSDKSDTHITVTAYVNERGMEQFAKVYTPYIEVIKPVALRKRMIYNLNKGLEKIRKRRTYDQ